jgi:hypothetical protein
MIIDVAADLTVALNEADDFKKFKVRTTLPKRQLGDLGAALKGIAVVNDESTAWVHEAALRKWAHASNNDQWQDSLTGMIAVAAKYGWIDAERKTIRAHIEWAE